MKNTAGWGKVRIRSMLAFLAYGARRGMLRIPPIKEVLTYGDGATLDVPGAPRVIHVPGHSPGARALHMQALGALFIGDAIATRNVMTGETGPRIAPFTADPTQALASLARLEDIEAGLVLPGHGEPWTNGVAAAISPRRGHRSPRSWVGRHQVGVRRVALDVGRDERTSRCHPERRGAGIVERRAGQLGRRHPDPSSASTSVCVKVM